MQPLTADLLGCYGQLYDHYGYEPHWWPIFGPDRLWEIMLGAVLVQQSRWERVEIAIQRLIEHGVAAPARLAALPAADLAPLLAGVAFPHQKAPNVVRLAQHVLAQPGADVATWLAQPAPALRRELLSLPGIGPETADVISCYAGGPRGVCG